MKIIAFTGQMGCGKSTAVQHLKDTNLGTRVELIKFAGPLYDMQEFIYRRVSSAYKRPESFTKDRKLLQWLGTNWGRDTISTTIWTDLWAAEVKYATENYPHAIITCDDVRFDNEAELVKSLGGVIIKLTSSRAADRIDTKSGISNHSSESGVSDNLIDFIINNDNTKEAFKDKLDKVFACIHNKEQK